MYKEKTLEALNRGHGGHNDGGVEGATSPLRSTSNGPPNNNNAYGMGGQNESAFARSPLQVSRPPNVQSSFYVK